MLHRRSFPFQDYETSTLKNEHEHLYEKVEELKGEHKVFVEYGNDFVYCKIFSA